MCGNTYCTAHEISIGLLVERLQIKYSLYRLRILKYIQEHRSDIFITPQLTCLIKWHIGWHFEMVKNKEQTA
jgi:hypothetical protein